MSASAGREKWWTGGRIAVAVIVVVLLMGGAGFAGFVAGVAVGTTNSFIDDLEGLDGLEGLEDDFDGFDMGNGVPGITPLDSEVAEGSPLQPGGRVNGVVGDRPVEHVLDLPAGGSVELVVTEANFDTVLVVLDGTGQVVTSDDDGGQGNLSRIAADLEPGTYRVRVQSWDGNGGGYTLVAR